MLRESFMMVPSLAMFYLANTYVISANRAEGSSMEPSVKNNSLLLVNRLPNRIKSIKKEDIIVARSPYRPELDICKRVLYLEGETVEGI